MRDMRMKRLALLLVLALAAGLAGCGMLMERHRADEPLERTRAADIRTGLTTKKEVLAWFGPPLAVARKGTIMIIPPPRSTRDGWQEVSSDTFFELFSSRHAAMEDPIVYYYDSYRERGMGFQLFFNALGGITIRSQVDRLWVLIDNRTGVVADYVFRDGKERAAPER